MSDTGSPSAWEILSYTSCLIIAIAMIWYIHRGSAYWGMNTATLVALLFVLGFLAITGYCAVQLFRLLFPSRKKSCPACQLLEKVIEIEETDPE